MQPELHSLFARERLRQDHVTPATDADGAASLASESIPLRRSRTQDGAAVSAELIRRLDRAA